MGLGELGMKLVFVPGLLCDAALWAPVQSKLLDQRHGCEISTHSLIGKRSIRSIASEGLPLLGEGAVVVGHSLGARVAIEMALAAPGRVTGLVLVCTGVRQGSESETASRRGLIENARREGMSTIAGPWADLVLSDRARKGELRDIAVSMAKRMPVEQYADQIEAFCAREDLEPALSQLSTPTLVVAATEDPLATPADAAWLQSRIADAQTRILPDAAHLLPLEQPDLLANVIATWLAGTFACPLSR